MRYLHILRQRRAFTLIELLVVILIIAILIAIAAPTFLGQRDKAHDSVAQQRLSVAYRAAKTDSVDQNPTSQGTYRLPTTGPGGKGLIQILAESEPQLNVRPTPGLPDKDEVAVLPTSTAKRLRVAARSGSGRLYAVDAPANGMHRVQLLAFADFETADMSAWSMADGSPATLFAAGGHLNTTGSDTMLVYKDAEPAQNWSVAARFRTGPGCRPSASCSSRLTRTSPSRRACTAASAGWSCGTSA